MRKPRNQNLVVRWLRDALCGILLGASAILPGVSAGVLAVVFDIYQPMMEILTYPRRAIPQYWGRIPPLIAGWCVGFVAFAKGIARLPGSVCYSDRVAVYRIDCGHDSGPVPGSGKGRPHTRRVGESAGMRGGGIRRAVLCQPCGPCSGGAEFLVVQLLRGPVWTECRDSRVTSSSVMMALGLYQPMLEGMARLDLLVLSACLRD